MRAVWLETFGEPADVLKVAERPAPEPAEGQIRVRMTHRPINPSDLAMIRGVYGILPTLPASPGFEGLGIVEALGPGVEGLSIGQRVVPIDARGTWAELALATASRAMPVPDEVEDVAAAQLVVNPATAWVMLTEELKAGPGDWVLQTAAGSTLGRMVIQLGKLVGFKTVNLVRREEQIPELEALGADLVLSTRDPELIRKVRAATGGGVCGAIDAVGGAAGKLALACLRPGRPLIVYGWLSGRPLPLNVGEVIFRGVSVRGFWLSTWFRQNPPERSRAVLSRLIELMASETLTPPVEATYDLANVRDACAHAERPGRAGKVLLVG